MDVMRQLKEHGRVIRPYVGIKMLQVGCCRHRQSAAAGNGVTGEGLALPLVALPCHRVDIKETSCFQLPCPRFARS